MTVKSLRRQLAAAIAMTLVSTVALGSSTYAWFTMNKEVSVVGMEMKAHAEEGLLINEVKAHADTNWDEQAQAAATAVTYQLRPASTANLATWYHANSKKSSDEAGVDDDLANTVKIGDNYYEDISPANLTNNTVIDAEGGSGTQKATGGTQAETHVYYKDAAFGTTGEYDEGEGFYVNYKYYLKASSTEDLTVKAGKLGVEVTAEKKNEEAATALDKALRVGVKIDNDVLIFAPVEGADDTSYKVTAALDGATTADVSAKTTKTGINAADMTIPAVNTDGKLVDVYLWFEGEDKNCMSDNLTATLNAYKISISFTNDDL